MPCDHAYRKVINLKPPITRELFHLKENEDCFVFYFALDIFTTYTDLYSRYYCQPHLIIFFLFHIIWMMYLYTLAVHALCEV